MGGRGSTRWGNHDRAPLVEGALCLDFLAPELKKALSQARASGEVRWSDTGSGSPRGWAEFHLGPAEPDGSRRLVLDRTGDDYEPKQIIALEPVTVGFSVRLYARCPAGCGRHARKLFEIPGRLTFACRECAGLQYASAQQHDKRIDDCRRDPMSFLEGRSRLRSLRSELTTFWIFEEAQRRGCRWMSPRQVREHLLAAAPPETRAELERLHLPHTRPSRLPKRRDRRTRK